MLSSLLKNLMHGLQEAVSVSDIFDLSKLFTQDKLYLFNKWSEDPTTSADVLRLLSQQSQAYESMFLNIAVHPNVPEDVLDALSRINWTELLLAVYNNPRTPAYIKQQVRMKLSE